MQTSQVIHSNPLLDFLLLKVSSGIRQHTACIPPTTASNSVFLFLRTAFQCSPSICPHIPSDLFREKSINNSYTVSTYYVLALF